MSSHFDVVIVGQGLAGTALAWLLRWRGARVLVVDRDQAFTSSRISAGLITPVTGQKMTRSWRFEELWPVAASHYRRAELETGRRFFRRTSMVRLFTSLAEHRQFEQCFPVTDAHPDVEFSSEPVDPQAFDVFHGGFVMSEGGQLDVVTYLEGSRQVFENDGCFHKRDLRFPEDVEFFPDGVRLPSMNIAANFLVLCQGFDGIGHHWFRDVQFKPCKGEILTIRIPGLAEERVVHRGIWLAPQGNHVFKVGATYEWTVLNGEPTVQGRDEITARLKSFLRLPFEVLAHSAAVRPIHKNQYPLLGFHPQWPQLGYFNGLGSKGTLHSPFFSQQLARAILDRTPVEAELDVTRRTPWTDPAARLKRDQAFHVKRGQPPLTQQAQDAVRGVVSQGDVVIDATTGNGYDTQFLAELVSPSGRVYAFDVQGAALEKTGRRLEEAGHKNVLLLNQCHSEMVNQIPTSHHGYVAAVMFNLGYLPGADKQVTTSAATSIEAIAQALALIREGGVVTVLAYTGHDGGASEAQAVADSLDRLDRNQFEVRTVESQPGRTSGPRMFLITRLSPQRH